MRLLSFIFSNHSSTSIADAMQETNHEHQRHLRCQRRAHGHRHFWRQPQGRSQRTAGHHRGQGRHRACRHRCRHRRSCGDGQRHPHRHARRLPVPRGRGGRRLPHRNPCLQRQPPVRLWPAGHRLGSSIDCAGRLRSGHWRRLRIHEPRPLLRHVRALGRTHGRCQEHRLHAGHPARPLAKNAYGHHC